MEMEEWKIAKKNYPLDHKVRIVRTGASSEVEGKTGTILGKCFVYAHDHYIVLLDEPTETNKAITITEHCLISADFTLPG